jgi:hypothetical protein
MYCYILLHPITSCVNTTGRFQFEFNLAYYDSCSTQLTSYILPRPWALHLRHQALESEAKLFSSGVPVAHSKSFVNTTSVDTGPSQYHGA